MGGYCKADDASVCEDCGVLVADGGRAEHKTFHEQIASAVARCSGPATPARANELQTQADRESWQLAWLCGCGTLNRGYWTNDSVCGGCRFSVERSAGVDGHYRLVPVEGLSDEEQD